jgi:hypothetical protein
MSVPQRRRLHFKDFDEARAEVQRLGAHPYARCGNWDLFQMCDHVSDAMDRCVSPAGFGFGLPWPLQALARTMILPVILWTGRIPAGTKVPEDRIPKPKGDPQRSVGEFERSTRQFEGHAGPFAPHPFFGRLTGEKWRRVHLIHIAHHLGFLVPDGSPDAATVS